MLESTTQRNQLYKSEAHACREYIENVCVCVKSTGQNRCFLLKLMENKFQKFVRQVKTSVTVLSSCLQLRKCKYYHF